MTFASIIERLATDGLRTLGRFFVCLFVFFHLDFRGDHGALTHARVEKPEGIRNEEHTPVVLRASAVGQFGIVFICRH